MGTILILLIVISFCSIFYFWLKKHNKKMIIASIVATFVFGSLYSLTPEYKQEAAKEEREAKVESHKKEVEKRKKEEAKAKSHKDERAEKKEISKPKSQNKIVKKSSKKPKQKKNITSKNDLLVRAKKLKYGMSLTEVKRIMKVEPTEEENDDGFISLTYGKDVVDLQFDEHKRLTAAATGAPQVTKQGEKAAQQKKKEAKSKESSLKSSAQYFGTKPSESIQNNPGAFKTTQDGDLLYILWNPGDHLPLLLRVDDASTNITNVYVYNKHGDNPKGRHLYTGRTIIQKKRSIIYD